MALAHDLQTEKQTPDVCLDPELSGAGYHRGSPRPGLTNKLAHAARHALTWLFRPSDRRALLGGCTDAEEIVQDPWPLLRRLDIFVSITSALMILLILLTVLQRTWSPRPNSPAEPCPEDWMYYQRRCYFFSEFEADWETSKRFCSSCGASLIFIDNKKEMNFITTQMWRPCVWIGLHKTEREILWLNGSTFDKQLFDVHGTGECVYIQSKEAFFSSCTVPKSWVCRKEPYQREENFV